MISNEIKLVIWDLDDTFWSGTLSEGAVNVVQENIDAVVELAKRGIVNSICSKNSYMEVQKFFNDNLPGLWEYFVFVRIAWESKSLMISEILSSAALRSENVLFIDDNYHNLKEVKHFLPDISVLHPSYGVKNILKHEKLLGKNDINLKRLMQYRQLEAKIKSIEYNKLDPIDFLRQSDITIRLSFDINENFERVVELINRTNQLNYTKRRVTDKASFKAYLSNYRTFAACVFCSDKYSDYGLVGFFAITKYGGVKDKLDFFCFSCRVLNIGVEAWCFEYLDKPVFDLVDPVAYPPDYYLPQDWIKHSAIDTVHRVRSDSTSTVLLGPCHLLQVSSYISGIMSFVQVSTHSGIIKYDSWAFLIPNLSPVAFNKMKSVCEDCFWDFHDYLRFHNAIPTADVLILSLGDLLRDSPQYVNEGSYYVADSIKPLSFPIKYISLRARISMLDRIVNYISDSVKDGAKIVLMPAVYSNKTISSLKYRSYVFNRWIAKTFESNQNVYSLWSFDNPPFADSALYDGLHLSRFDYFTLSNTIKNGLFYRSHKYIKMPFFAILMAALLDYFSTRFARLKYTIKRIIR